METLRRVVGLRRVAVFTVGPKEIGRTGTFKVVYEVLTDALVLAWTAGTVVQVNGAILAGESRRATAHVVVDAVSADAAVGTGLHKAVVHIHLAQFTDKARHTETTEGVDLIFAGATVETGVRFAIVDVHFAVSTRETGTALAGVAFLRGESGIGNTFTA